MKSLKQPTTISAPESQGKFEQFIGLIRGSIVQLIENLGGGKYLQVRNSRRQCKNAMAGYTREKELMIGALVAGLTISVSQCHETMDDDAMHHDAMYYIDHFHPDMSIEDKEELAEQVNENVGNFLSKPDEYEHLCTGYIKKKFVKKIEKFATDGTDDDKILSKLLKDCRRGDMRPFKHIDGSVFLNEVNEEIWLPKTGASLLTTVNEELYQEKGVELEIMRCFRSLEYQYVLDAHLGDDATAAAYGESFHNIGFACDITNWRKAEQLLLGAGMRGGCKGLGQKDLHHFSWGEITPNIWEESKCKAVEGGKVIKRAGEEGLKWIRSKF